VSDDDKRNVIANVRRDIKELRRLGVAVPSGALRYVDNNKDEIIEWHQNGLMTYEITDLISNLVGTTTTQGGK
jgi:hypothetical protein